MNLTTHLEYQLVAQARARELKLLIRLHAPAVQTTTRKPLNLGVVIDRSGSMSGDKIEHTRKALQTLITHLGPEDHLSLVLFDDHVQVLLEPTRVTDKDALKQLVAARTRVLPFTNAVMDAAFRASMEVFAQNDAKSPEWKKIYADMRAFQRDQILWFRFAESRYDAYLSAQKI